MNLPEGLRCYDSQCILVLVQRPQMRQGTSLPCFSSDFFPTFVLEDSLVALQNLSSMLLPNVPSPFSHMLNLYHDLVALPNFS